MLQSLPILLGVRPESTLRPHDERLQEGIQQLKFEREDASRLAVWLCTLLDQDAKRDEIRQTLDAEDPVKVVGCRPRTAQFSPIIPMEQHERFTSWTGTIGGGWARESGDGQTS